MEWGVVGTIVSVVMYLTVGFFAAVESINLSQWLFNGTQERIFYGAFTGDYSD